EIFAVGAEGDALGEPAGIDRADLAYLAARGREHLDDGVRVCVPHALGDAATAVLRERHGKIAARTHVEAFRQGAYADIIDDMGRRRLEIDDGDRARPAIRGSAIALVDRESEAAIGGDLHIVRIDADRDIRLVVSHLLSIDVEKR